MHASKPVLTVGAANVERVLECGRVTLGDKHLVAPGVESAGGSALNHSCRLLAAGFPAWPLVPLGGDTLAHVVRDVAEAAADTGGLSGFGLSRWFTRIANVEASTAVTTLIVEGDGRRTVLCESGTASQGFAARAADILGELEPRSLAGVIIGHIHSDASSAGPGTTTSRVIARYADHAPVLVNLGRSQYRLGPQRWVPELRQVDIFQLSLLEAHEFCGVGPLSIRAIADWFRDHGINAVITIDRFGALGVLRDDPHVVFAWPYELGERVRDSTGAGDAMAAAIMAEMVATGTRARDWTAAELSTALRRGRKWASYACTKLGGAGECPSAAELERFSTVAAAHRLPDIKSLDDLDSVFWLIDRAWRS